MMTIGDAAVSAAHDVAQSKGWDQIPRAAVRNMLEAALPHLTDAGMPLDFGSLKPVRIVPESEYDQAFARGVRIGREEAQLEVVTAEVGPSDYEVWRDALTLATKRLGNDGPRSNLVDLAEWFWERLGEVPVRNDDQPEATCAECGGLDQHTDTCSATLLRRGRDPRQHSCDTIHDDDDEDD